MKPGNAKNYLKYYNELNALQRLAVDAIDGPVLVLAGPGTGKTQLLSVRAASILNRKDISPEEILIVTYTNSAVKEMKERVAKVIGIKGYDVEVATFHSFANSIIQESEDARNYVGDRIQMSEVERVKAIEYVIDHTDGIEDIKPFRAPYFYLDDILRRIGDFKREGLDPGYIAGYIRSKKNREMDLEEKHVRRFAALSTIYRKYEELKEGKTKDIFDSRGRYDFDDMILFAAQALKEGEDLRKEYSERFKYIMVDEYQDTNGAQLDFLFTLVGGGEPNLCCVGDDDQSIYRFQGASVKNFLILKERFPVIKTLSLEDNYRSSKDLIDLSARVINMIPLKERTGEKFLNPIKKYSKKDILFREFTTPEEELQFVVDKVKELKDSILSSSDLPKELREHPYNNIAVIVRKRSDILRVIDALLKAGIPYATDGKEDISGEKRVKQLLDALELARVEAKDHDLKDLALFKVLTSDYFQIPMQDIMRLVSSANLKRLERPARPVTLLSEFLGYFAEKRRDIGFQDEESLSRAAIAIGRLLTDTNSRPVHAILLDFVNDAGIFKYILREYADRDILRIRDLRSLTSFINMVKASDLARPAIRLEELAEEIRIRKDHGLPVQGSLVTMTQEGVRILTAHASKGQEFHAVIMPFCLENKNWPARQRPEKLPLPPGLFKTKEAVKDKAALKQLYMHDETRLFYVSMTRAKSNLIFTSSPSENTVSSSYLGSLDIKKRDGSNETEEEILKRFLQTTDKLDPFIGTEAVLKDMITNMTLNPTRVNNYIACRRKFLYNDILKLPGPKKRSLVFGNCVHKALEDTYRAFQNDSRFPSFKFFSDAFRRELKFQGPDKTIERECLGQDRMRKLKSWFEKTARHPVMPLGLEKKLIANITEDLIFTGKYDKIEWIDEKNGLVKIVDYKTGKPDKHIKSIAAGADLASDDCDGYLRQLIAYRLLYEKDRSESKGKRALHGELVFIEPLSTDMRKEGYSKGDHINKTVEISDAMVLAMEELIKEVWAGIKRLDFEKLKERDENKCGNCDFDGICWG